MTDAGGGLGTASGRITLLCQQWSGTRHSGAMQNVRIKDQSRSQTSWPSQSSRLVIGCEARWKVSQGRLWDKHIEHFLMKKYLSSTY